MGAGTDGHGTGKDGMDGSVRRTDDAGEEEDEDEDEVKELGRNKRERVRNSFRSLTFSLIDTLSPDFISR